ncbi:MAG: hypothetical protein LBM56_03695 [Burkholderiaceae bacterium]|jgi:hypothetical protein|nr:hypothetical protein [Burkholderiaceae bacterium]
MNNSSGFFSRLSSPLLFACAVLLTFLGSAQAGDAAKTSANGLSFGTPMEWTHTSRKGTNFLVSPKKNCIVSFRLGKADGADARTIASQLAKHTNGRVAPIKGQVTGYQIKSESNGQPMVSYVYSNGKRMFLFTEAGGKCAKPDDSYAVLDIWNSLLYYNANLKKLGMSKRTLNQ